MITLIEESHKYINTESDEEYASVSKVLSQFKKPFDTKYWAEKKAKDYGTSADEVIQLWDDLKDHSCARGKNYHKIMEDFIVDGKRTEDNDSLYDSFSYNIQPLGDTRRIHAERIVYSHEHKIAGMSDVIIDHPYNQFSIVDFKTNKNFRYNSKYGEYLLAPVEHLQACEFNNYTLQLSLYAYMYSQLTGYTVKSLAINYLDQETQRWQNVPVHYMKYEALLLLRSYNPKL
jgi:ATP-dependent exoDNAse (exonuclease V) beta subunit